MALEMEVEMEQRVAEASEEKGVRDDGQSRGQALKEGRPLKKEIEEILKGIESEIRVKWEAILMEARQNTLERSN